MSGRGASQVREAGLAELAEEIRGQGAAIRTILERIERTDAEAKERREAKEA